LRIGATELIVADVLDHQPVWTVAGVAGLSHVRPRPFAHTGLEVLRVELYPVWLTIDQEMPGRELPRVRRIGEVHDIKEAASASKIRGLGEPVRPAIRGEGPHVALAAWQLDVGQQDWVAAVARNVINGKVRPPVLGGHEEVAPIIGLHRLVRGKRRGSVG